MSISFIMTTPHNINLPYITTVATQAIKQAGITALKYFRQSPQHLNIQNKNEVSNLLTQADLEVESTIISTIQTHFPTHHIITEESSSNTPLTNHPTWIIDPIDGTTAFATGKPTFCHLIAFCLNKTPILGLVYQPFLNELYIADTINNTLIFNNLLVSHKHITPHTPPQHSQTSPTNNTTLSHQKTHTQNNHISHTDQHTSQQQSQIVLSHSNVPTKSNSNAHSTSPTTTLTSHTVQPTLSIHNLTQLLSKPINQAILATTLCPHTPNYLTTSQLQLFQSLSTQVCTTTYGGDAYNYLLLAQSFIDIIIEGSLKIWDIAALLPILHLSGAQTFTINNATLTPTTLSNFNGSIIVINSSNTAQQ